MTRQDRALQDDRLAADGPTAALARRASLLRYDDLPTDVVLVAKHCVLDTLGVALAAASESVVAIVRRVAELDGGSGQSTLLDGSGRRVSPSAATFVNATAAHAIDFDDMYPAMAGHPSAALVPTVLALGEDRGSSGREVLAALVAGFETEFRVGAAVMPSHYARGFHPTGTAGTFGTAAAAAHLLGLSPQRMETALGIAASQAAGLTIMFGTMTKPLQAGRAAVSGLLSARLAAAGVTSATGVIEGANGFAMTQADALDLDVLGAPFGDPWAILQTVFKRHAACGYTHAAIDAMISVKDRVDIDDIESIHLTVNPETLLAAGISAPTTPLEAKFSVWWVAAMALSASRVDARQFVPDLVHDQSIRELAGRIGLSVSEDIPRLGCIARVTTRSGDVIVEERDCERPLWSTEPGEQTDILVEKFDSLVEPVFGSRGAAWLRRTVLALDEVADIRTLMQIMAA